MKDRNTEMTKMEAIVVLLDLGRTADDRTCRAAMLGAKALARHLKHKAANHASRVARGLPACHAPEAVGPQGYDATDAECLSCWNGGGVEC